METTDNLEQAIQSIKTQLVCDGKIDKDGVVKLRDFLQDQDGKYNVDRGKADLLFYLFNSAKDKQVVDDSFYSLFKDAICAYLLKDHSSTGILDDKEVDWLVGQIENNLEIDDTIFDLIQELKAKSFNNFPKKLDSAIILRRLRVILKLLSNSETDNGCKKKVEGYITALNKYLERRKQFSVDEDCIIILFSIKKKIVLNKQLGFNIEENLDKPKTVEYKFAKLFYDIVSSFVLYDENSPYDIDDDEAKLLMKNINKNASADILDKVLLDQLKSRSMDFPELLAKAQFEIKTSDVRALIVNVLAKDKVEAKDKEEAINQLDAYLVDSFGCIDEQKLKVGLLFKLKNLTKPDITDDEENDIVSEIRKKFVEKVTEYITGANSQSPNEIDEKEEKWLIEELSVSEDRYYLCDEELLKQLKERSVNYPKSLELLLSDKIMKRKLLEFRDEDWKWEQFDGDDLNEIKSALYDDYNEIKTDKKGAAEFIFKIKDIIYESTLKSQYFSPPTPICG